MTKNERTQSVEDIFIEETCALAQKIKKNSVPSPTLLSLIIAHKDTAAMISKNEVALLCFALQSVFRALLDEKIVHSENLTSLITLIAEKMEAVAKNGEENEKDVLPFLIFSDKAAAGEIFDISELLPAVKKNQKMEKNDFDFSPNQTVSIPLKKMNTILIDFEELLARTYKISSEISKIDSSSIQNKIASDVEFVRNGIFSLHKTMTQSVKDESFLKNHQNTHGFFVFVGKKKYFIAGNCIVDIMHQVKKEYVIEQNQRYLLRVEKNENGEDVHQKIPVYALSSLFQGHEKTKKAAFDTVLIAEYQNQKVGIIAEKVENFSMVVKKELPPSFVNFKKLEGLVFDEKYTMIPMLSVPFILKQFRSLRGYDVKKFEANTRVRTKRILLADDSETTRQILKTILRSADYEVECAQDGIIALEKLKKQHFDALVTDSDMPRMNGEILADNVRRLLDKKNFPIIALSSAPIHKTDAFISKENFERGELLQKIREMTND